MGGGRGGAACWVWLGDDERRRSGCFSGVRVSPSFLQAFRPEASADFLRSLTALPGRAWCLPLDLAPAGSSLPPGGWGGGRDPGKGRGTPRDGSSWPLLRPSTVPGAARPSRLVPLICRVWRRTSARTSEVPRQPGPGYRQGPEQPRSGREASLGKPSVPLEEALSCREVPHLRQPVRRVPRSSLQSGLGDGVARLLHFEAEEAAVLRGNSAPAVPQPAR